MEQGPEAIVIRDARDRSWVLFLPSLVALVLAIPCGDFPYLWDDFGFLKHAQTTGLRGLIPNPGDVFYRPLSRDVYFGILNSAGQSGLRLGHISNALLLFFSIYLLVTFVGTLAGKRAGVLAGFCFAALSPLPVLTGWISGVQDLLAIAFVLLALNAQLAGRGLLALCACALGLLAKETTAVVIPAIAFSPVLVGRQSIRRAVPELLLYGILLIGWAATHPGIRQLVQHGLAGGATGYVGLEHPERWLSYFGRYALVTANLPIPGILAPWPRELTVILLVAAAIVTGGIAALSREWGVRVPAVRGWRIVLLSVALALPPLLLISTMLRSWAPYYAVFPAIGTSVILGFTLSRLDVRASLFALVAFLTVGVGSRDSRLDTRLPSEHNFRMTGGVLRSVEAQFKSHRASFPRGSQILVSIQTSGLAGLQTHLYFHQALRFWYADSTLRTMRPDWRTQGRPEFLFWIGPRLDVHEVDPRSLRISRIGRPKPSYPDYQLTMRYYARGLAASGEVNKGVGILRLMPEADPRAASFDDRLAAMLLYADGRDDEAAKLLRGAVPISREEALELVGHLVADAPPHFILDDHALRAFDLPREDAEVWRFLMRRFDLKEHPVDGLRFARRVLSLSPNDAEANRTIERLGGLHPETALLGRPAPPD